jgi:hypothetical protein
MLDEILRRETEMVSACDLDNLLETVETQHVEVKRSYAARKIEDLQLHRWADDGGWILLRPMTTLTSARGEKRPARER